MATFDFSTLNSADLEELACDLLNAQEIQQGSRIRFKTFRDGKDQGIDFAFEQDYLTKIIGQVKHYYRSGYNLLYKELQEKEVSNIIKLRPKKYIVVTSVDLTRKQTQDIKQLFRPYTNSINIYGKKDLNRLIDTYPAILENHFKLWFSSSVVLKKLLYYSQIGRSGEFIEHRFKNKLRLYVKTNQLDEAQQALKKNKFIIITGEPGSGKTALAELILYEHIKDNYELTYIANDLADIEKQIKPDDSKQIFYFDDFLGHTEKEMSKAKASEAYLLNILQRISWGVNKKLVLTTRTFILNAAIEESERLHRLRLHARESTVDLNTYKPELREQLVRNHAEESMLPDALKKIITEPAVMRFIVEHPNFYPRSVEFITLLEQAGSFTPEAYKQFIYSNFNKPDEIWRHAYTYQINDTDRLLLTTMLSFGYNVKINKLERAFIQRVAFEEHYHNFKSPPNPFRSAMQRLMGGFITSETPWDPVLEDTYTFINPSLVDFLVQYLKEDQSEVIKIAASAKYVCQLFERLFNFKQSKPNYVIPPLLEARLLANLSDFIIDDPNYDYLGAGLIFHHYGANIVCKQSCFTYLCKIKGWDAFNPPDKPMDWLEELLINETDPEFIAQIKAIGVGVFYRYIAWTFDFQDLKTKLSLMKERYGFTLEDLMAYPGYMDWDDYFSEMLTCMVNDRLEGLGREYHDLERMEEEKRYLIRMREQMRNFGTNPKLDFSRFIDYETDFEAY